ncbi:glycosyltransferase family 4 protein [Polaribacter atrinae]|uniref:glycosyltransferase family 4 protein n=1 Tax=Polaribacter atrinae TaxID=1333662 RepID=UPI0030FC2165
MRKKIDLLHVYAGTRGASGLYLDEIYNALKCKYKQEVIVSAFYPFSYGKKWFYRYSDISSIKLNILNINIIRKAVRFCELILTLIRTFIYIKIKKIRFVNYGLTSDLKIELFFIKLLKFKSDVKIIVTCHDVLPFGSDNPIILSKKIAKKKNFFDIADFLLIHNENSKKELKKYYNISDKKVFMIYFPLMDLNNLEIEHTAIKLIKNKGQFTIGMFGNLRQEKGVDVLLKAWSKVHEQSKNLQLIIAGYVPPNIDYCFENYKDKSVLIYDQFICDSEFKSLISTCDLVVLPYKRGTNSGIPSQIISSGTLVLASDIPMFKNNSIILKDFLFKSEDYNDLFRKILWASSLGKEEIEGYDKNNKKLLRNYKELFSDKIILEFDQIIK